MPSLETKDRRQAALLFARTGSDDYGEPTVAEPIEIRVRWNTKRTEVQDANGSTIALDAVVVVDRVISIGSRMWLGEEADWYGTGSGTDESQDQEMHVVRTYDEVKDVKARHTRRTVGLSKFRDV